VCFGFACNIRLHNAIALAFQKGSELTEPTSVM